MTTLNTDTIDKTPIIYSKDFFEWPESWMGLDEDIPTGVVILKGFVLFIKDLEKQGRSKRTIKSHMDNLWVLGGEVIRGVHFDEGQRQLSSKGLLLEYVNAEGGPYVHQWNPADRAEENNIKAYDLTCRKLYEFLKLTN